MAHYNISNRVSHLLIFLSRTRREREREHLGAHTRESERERAFECIYERERERQFQPFVQNVEIEFRTYFFTEINVFVVTQRLKY